MHRPNRHRSRTRFATAALAASIVAVGLAFASPTQAAPADATTTSATRTPVMAQARLTGPQMASYFRSKGKTSQATVSIDVLAAHFISEGAAEGVAGDLAFAQSIVETGWFGFSARVPPSFNNFSGIGAVDGGTSAASFRSAQIGVRAQIQHLRAYADPNVTIATLAHPLESPRFHLVLPKGRSPLWEQFGGGNWATDPLYAGKVLNIYQQMLDHAGVLRTSPPDLPSPRWAPFTTADGVVRRAYADILRRPPTARELAAGVDALLTDALTPAELLASLLGGEGARHAQPVARLYLAALGRTPDPSGLDYWTRRHRSGVSIRRLADQFIASSEFQRRYGVPSVADFVDLVYRNVLGRPGDPSGIDYWGRRLADGRVSRSELLVQMSESSEHRRRTGPATEAAVAYLGMIGRAPDAIVVAWWADRRASGASLSVLTHMVWTSASYRTRVGG
jgi:hypothetical protein